MARAGQQRISGRGRINEEHAVRNYKFKNPEASLEGSRELHETIIPAIVLKTCTRIKGIGGFVAMTAPARVTDVLQQMQPRDPIEAMMIRQIMIVDARIMSLSIEVDDQADAETFRVMSEALTAASNLFRRQVLALEAYKAGADRRGADPIQQTNIAGQMIVQNFPPNELESRNEPHNVKGLSPFSERPSIEAEAHPASSALAEGDRPEER